VKVAGTVKASGDIAISGVVVKEWNNVAPELVPNGRTDSVYLVYIPRLKAGLSGYVFADANSNYRVAGAVVEVVVGDQTYSATTGDSYANYDVSDIPAGNWLVRIKVAGTVKWTENINLTGVTPTNPYGVTQVEWVNVAPELVPDKTADGVRVFYMPHTGWGSIQSVRVRVG
jgi:hypothetical protein